MMTGRTVLLGGFIVRMVRTKRFTDAVVDCDEEGKSRKSGDTWYE